jgi:hypothetical protein
VIEFEFYHPLAMVAAIAVARGRGAFTPIIVPVYFRTIDPGGRLAWLQGLDGHRESRDLTKRPFKKGPLNWIAPGATPRIIRAPVTTAEIDQFGQQLTILRVSPSNRALTPRDGGILISQRDLLPWDGQILCDHPLIALGKIDRRCRQFPGIRPADRQSQSRS